MKWLDEFISEFNYKSHRDLMREHFVASPVNKSGQVYRTNEEIYEIAKRFTKMKVFRSKEPDVYQISLKRKLISQFTWLERANNKSGVPYLDNVYAYEFAETKSVYIGRTVDIERRHEEHCRKPGDTVCKYATEHGIEIPRPKILHTGISITTGATLEGDEIEKYRELGWNILNRCKAGSIGLLGTFISKASALRIAKRYKYNDELRHEQPRVYGFLVRNNMIADCTWLEYRGHTRNGTFNVYENCLREAKKYTLIGEFRLKSPGAYSGAKRHGWLKSFTWLKKKQGGSPKRHVGQYNSDGTVLIKTFNSISDAAKETGLGLKNVQRACACNCSERYKDTLHLCGGFVWKYIDISDANKREYYEGRDNSLANSKYHKAYYQTHSKKIVAKAKKVYDTKKSAGYRYRKDPVTGKHRWVFVGKPGTKKTPKPVSGVA
jgi:hypothetical protein